MNSSKKMYEVESCGLGAVASSVAVTNLGELGAGSNGRSCVLGSNNQTETSLTAPRKWLRNILTSWDQLLCNEEYGLMIMYFYKANMA